MAADRYSRVSRRIWRDAKFTALSGPKPNARDLWIFLLTGPHCTSIPGLFVLGEGAMAEELGWPVAGTRLALEEIERAEMLRYDRVHRVVWMPNAFRHNVPNNHNQVTGWKVPWSEIPDCALKAEARVKLQGYLADTEKFSDEFRQAFLRAMGEAPPKASTNPCGGHKGFVPKGKGNRSRTNGERSTEPFGQPSANEQPTQDLELEPDQKPPPTPAVELAATGTDAARPNPEVVVDEPKATEPRTPEAKPAEPEAPAAQPERPLADVVTLLSPADRNAGEALAQAMATASGGMFDPLSGSTAKRAELYRRLKHYRVTPAEAVVMGECCAEPGKTWKWATTISNGFGLGFLLGSETAEGFSGDALSQLVQIARKRIAAVQRAALAKAEAAALPPPAPRKPPATPEELAAIRPSFARALAPVAPPATPTEVTHG